LKELYDGSRKLKEDIAKGVSVYTGIEISKIQALMIDGGVTLTAEEAETKGSISNITEPTIPVNADIISISNG